jgi:hypothetical protein
MIKEFISTDFFKFSKMDSNLLPFIVPFFKKFIKPACITCALQNEDFRLQKRKTSCFKITTEKLEKHFYSSKVYLNQSFSTTT